MCICGVCMQNAQLGGNMYYIGVDLGTSAVKLLLMEESGKICNIVSKEYPLFFPHPGWSEQNPEDWFTQSVEGMKELTEGIDRSQVAGIGFGGQMHGLVTLDENDNVIRPAILWNDGRSQKETEYLNNEIGKDKLSQYTANIAFAGFTAPKILWMKKNEPEKFAKIAKIMLPKDNLAYRLYGSFCTDLRRLGRTSSETVRKLGSCRNTETRSCKRTRILCRRQSRSRSRRQCGSSSRNRNCW